MTKRQFFQLERQKRIKNSHARHTLAGATYRQMDRLDYDYYDLVEKFFF